MSKLIYKGDILTSTPNDARLIDYTNSVSGLSGDTVQQAIDEIAGVITPASPDKLGTVKPDNSTIVSTEGVLAVGTVSSSSITFNNSDTGLTSMNVQSAIIEVSSKVPSVETEDINFNIF